MDFAACEYLDARNSTSVSVGISLEKNLGQGDVTESLVPAFLYVCVGMYCYLPVCLSVSVIYVSACLLECFCVAMTVCVVACLCVVLCMSLCCLLVCWSASMLP